MTNAAVSCGLLMCGMALSFRASIQLSSFSLQHGAAMLRRGEKKSGATERRRLSAHQAAEPQDAAICL